MNVLAFVHLRNIHRSTGAGRVARELIEHVSRETNVKIRILADGRDYAEIVPKVGKPWTEFHYHLFANDTSVQQAKWLMLGSPTAESFWPEAQVVHCTGESYVPTKKARLMVTVHDAAYFDQGAHAPTVANRKQALKWRFLYHRLAKTADAFHTVSQFSAERLAVAFPQIRSRLRVIHNGVSSAFFEPASENESRLLAQQGLRDRPFVLLCGGLHYRKNADLVLRAWPILHERHPELTLAVAGHCDPHYRKQAERLHDSVVYTGFLEDIELRAIYRAARALWFPSRYEGFGLPPLEAMACGTPVVASNTSSIPEITGDAALLADPDSVEQHVELLEQAILCGATRERLQDAGRKRAREFSWVNAGRQLQQVYGSLV